MKTIGITGGTGLVGHHLAPLLIDKGYEVIIFTRSTAKKPAIPHIAYAHWDASTGAHDINALKKADAIVHLTGAGIADKRWTAKRKKEIKDSRVNSTNHLVSQLKANATNCKTFISASATGFYGADNGLNRPFTETDAPAHDFLGDTCIAWEEAALQAADFVRTVILRNGVVLAADGGAFAAFSKPVSLGIMPILGPGDQVVSWVSVSDLTRFILFALEHNDVKGIYNAVAPQPVTHKQLMKTIASVKGGIRIPAPVPSFLLNILVGEMSAEVLKSCTVSAQKVLDSGFVFEHPDIEKAVKSILGKN